MPPQAAGVAIPLSAELILLYVMDLLLTFGLTRTTKRGAWVPTSSVVVLGQPLPLVEGNLLSPRLDLSDRLISRLGTEAHSERLSTCAHSELSSKLGLVPCWLGKMEIYSLGYRTPRPAFGCDHRI